MGQLRLDRRGGSRKAKTPRPPNRSERIFGCRLCKDKDGFFGYETVRLWAFKHHMVVKHGIGERDLKRATVRTTLHVNFGDSGRTYLTIELNGAIVGNVVAKAPIGLPEDEQ